MIKQNKGLPAVRHGFTLIEILVVIGIIAILATIVLIAINPARQFRQANDSQRTSNVNAILNAVGQFIADNKGARPDGIPVLPLPAGEVSEALCLDLVPKYLPAMPADPSNPTESYTDCADVDAGDVDYTVSEDGQGRITVSAVGEEPPASVISVTR
ncbi:MAG: hypothetical protein UW30_C0011G0025 [Candidatus Giovannonibacteria bacterium GW2011_GWA2_44_13b]|uniref:Uncharacterized protein n=2 Tax=Candidatus Giovannoniibacteriota TaxID=1752738 RepID=A0A0G1K0A9_9BACT|nr:MAG: hypothetical protein UW30_C0011G0025 [Candidatus Giovannonibacteria bacterium GW2011_GWA2_44_13b]OGF82082.1 MAG: hypothetical protein A2924_01960 [Candidatus Giovannonibacteria bacterium RIFCSPLOWO2_01_FULL_44_16]